MPEPKTRPTNASVDDFIAAVPDARRRADAERALGLLIEVSGQRPVMWGPSIVGFGVYRGPTGDWPVIGFSPRRAETVFYLAPGFEAKAELMTRLGPARTGVSCLYVKRLDPIDEGVLRELCARSVAAVRKRYPAGAVP